MNSKILGLFAALLLGANAVPSGFDRVLNALADSTAPGGRSTAAIVLAEEGAHPIDGAVDLSALWMSTRGIPKSPVYRKRALGPGYRAVRLAGGEAIRLEQVFLAGQRAQVAVAAQEITKFSLTVSDDDQQTSCAASHRHAKCDWTPYYTTRFKIDLINSGNSPNVFYLVLQ